MTVRVTLRLDFANGRRLGHGKVSLLEAIARHGSIAAAGREFGMSYRRAWLLVGEMNRMFRAPLVVTRGGGSGGGGASLTETGSDIVALYRAAERRAAVSCEAEIARIEQAVAEL